MKPFIIKRNAAILLASALGATAQAQTSLFTTTDDFVGSSDASFVSTPTSTFDVDGSTINGLGNTTAPGATGTAGSLSLSWASGTYDYVYFSPGEEGNAAFLSALESAATLSYDFTTPSAGSGNYFQLGLVLNYENGFDQLFPTTTTDLGGGVTRATIDFTSEAATLAATQASNGGSFSYFSLGLIYNSNYTPGSPFYVDNIQVTPAPVPEPATAALLGVGGMALLFFRRRAGR